MAVQLLHRGSFRLLWQSGAEVLLRHPQRFLWHCNFQLPPNTPSHNIRLLHVKMYDKDAGMEEQRRSNREWFEPSTHYDNLTKSESHLSEADNPKDNFEEDDDIFGNNSVYDTNEDVGDLVEKEYTENRSRSLRLIDYARLIKTYLKEKRLKEAIAVLEVQMIKEDRAKPDEYIYNLLISSCAKAGYTRKAFNLFTKMRQRGLTVKGGTYTSLFNACANTSHTQYGIEQANRLREVMLEKAYEPNVKNYNAMIKAYGRCGDVKTAYLLADEMMEKGLQVNIETFNFLLQACASDSEFGFRHCLLTWHKMLIRGLSPDYYTFNTVLRCVRDCGFGDLVTMEQVLQQILTERNDAKDKELQIGSGEISRATQKSHAIAVENAIQQLEMPNLLEPQPHLGSLVSLSEVVRPHERFLLLGGFSSFLDLMKRNKVTPDIETFTMMLEVIPPTYAAEKQLLSAVRRIGLKADIDFFNILIKKRSMRFDYDGAKEVISMIRTARLHPDIVTYGVLALGCQTKEAARELLQQMQENGIRMNTQILGAMLRQGCENRSFPYIIEILQISLDENVKPNDIFLSNLHNFYNRCARAIDARHPSTKSKSFRCGHTKFCDKLRLYYEEQGIAGLKLQDAIKKIREHPYKQYKEIDVDGLEPLKNERISKKQKIRKYIKKIKIENLRSDANESLIVAGNTQKQLE